MTVKTVLITAVLGFSFLAPSAQAFNCDVTATGLAFGPYDFLASFPTDTTGSVSVSCTIPAQNPHAPLAVTISLSPGSSGSFAQRQMQSGGPDLLSYNLYTNPSFSTIWGDGNGPSSSQTAFITSDTPFTAVIYGRIPAGQKVPVGTYSDVITVTIEW